MKHILKAESITISVYILAYISAKTFLFEVGHYWGVIAWSVVLVGWLNFMISLAKPKAGLICALLYPVMIVFSHAVTSDHNSGGAVCLWGGIAMIIVITFIVHKLEKRKQ